MENLLYTIAQYGHITIELKPLMDKKHITRYALARAVNTRFEVIDKWYRGHVEKMHAGRYYSLYSGRRIEHIKKRLL